MFMQQSRARQIDAGQALLGCSDTSGVLRVRACVRYTCVPKTKKLQGLTCRAERGDDESVRIFFVFIASNQTLAIY